MLYMHYIQNSVFCGVGYQQVFETHHLGPNDHCFRECSHGFADEFPFESMVFQDGLESVF